MGIVDKLKEKYKDNMEILLTPQWVTDEVAAERLKICEDCPNLQKPLYRCSECGCFMKIKTKIKGASCPLPEKKWNAL